MKNIVMTLLCASITLGAIACTESVNPTNSPAPVTKVPSSTPADSLATAKLNYTKNCADCHGPTGEGGAIKVDGKEINIPSLKSDHAIKRTDDRIAKMISEGEEAMPPFKDKLNAQEIADLVRFVRKEFQGK